jgi:phenylacetate-CoA ligase
MSPAGILFHEGIRACGATVVPTGVGNVEAQIKTMLDLKVTGYAGMPSFLMTLIKSAEEMGHDFRRAFALKRAWFTGEMLPPSLRKTFEEDYGIATFQCYAATDLGGCVAYECSEKSGMHFMDEYVIEIVDPQTGEQLSPDAIGEIVATPLHNPAWGLIRYGTGDLSMYVTEPCPCGRSSYRLGGIVGRAADAVKVRGMFVIAKQAEQVFSEFDQISRYQIVVGRKEERDELVLRVELTDEAIDTHELSQRLRERFPQACRVRPDRIEFAPPGTIGEDTQAIVDERRWE